MDVSVVSLQLLRFRVCTEIAESFRRFFRGSEGCGFPWRQAGLAVNKEEPIQFFFYKIGHLMFTVEMFNIFFLPFAALNAENEQLKQMSN